MVVPGTVSGKPGGEHRVAGDVVALLGDLADAPADHVVEEPGVEVVARDDRVEHARQQVDGVDAREGAPRLSAPDRRADDVDDDGFSAHASKPTAHELG